MTAMRYSDQDKLKCVERELKIRQRVYANRILTRRMSRLQADRELAIMAEIAEDYRARAQLPL